MSVGAAEGGRDPLVAEIVHSRLEGLYDYWRGKRAGRPFPSRRDIDPLEMGAWLGNLLLIACEPGVTYRYVVYGTEFVTAFGVDLTGRLLGVLPNEQSRLLAQEYDTVRMSGNGGTIEVEASARSILPIHTLQIVQQGQVPGWFSSKFVLF